MVRKQFFGKSPQRNAILAVTFCCLLVVCYLVGWHVHTYQNIAQYKSTQNCKPKRRVAFLKVHKAASTTFANILKRYGYFRNITFAIPSNKRSHFAQFDTLSPDIMETIPINRPPDILFHHVVYNRTAFQSFLPHDMVYVASVREPISWFVSAFLYYKYDYRVMTVLKKTNKDIMFYIREYLKSPQKYEYGLPILRALHRFPYDFGVPADKVQDLSYVKNYLTQLNIDFSAVLIAEYFDESLVLFKRYMCWELRDIFYIRRQVSHRAKPNTLPPGLLQLYRKLAPANFLIYEFFLEQYYKRVKLQGSGFHSEVDTFKRMLKIVKSFCEEFPLNETSITLSSEWTGEFKISGLDCFVMIYQKPVKLLAEDKRRLSLL